MNKDLKDKSKFLKNFDIPILKDRRSFIKTMLIGGVTLTFGCVTLPGKKIKTTKNKNSYSMVLVDFNKCTGCRTCETICAQYNHKVNVNGEKLLGLGNPYLSNIKVYSFNPDSDIPILCTMCKDNPCIEACVVKPDKNGNKALFRDPTLKTIKVDLKRCVACGSCADACKTERSGSIIPNPKTNHPERMCTLCDGDPQCVKHCPYDALSYVIDGLEGQHYAQSPEDIAEELIKRWYAVDDMKKAWQGGKK